MPIDDKGSRQQLRTNRLIAVFIILTLVFIAWQLRDQLLDLLRFIADREKFTAYINSFGLWGPVVLFLLQVTQVIVSLFPGYAFFLAAGYLYGIPLGFLLNFSSIVIASQISFQIGRTFGRPIATRLAPAAAIDRWDNAAKKYGFRFFLISFLLPIFPADTMNYVAGLSTISSGSFLLASMLGRAPSIMLHTIVGATASELISLGFPWWGWALGVLVFLLLYFGWQYKLNRMGPDTLGFGPATAAKPVPSPATADSETAETPALSEEQASDGPQIPKTSFHFAKLPRTTLHYVRCGEGGPPLIMVPATVSRIENWLSLAQMMGRHFTVYFFELPGHGKSTAFSDKYSSKLVAETIEDFIDELQLERVSLMGFSFGGVLVMHSLHHLKQRIDQVILYAPALSQDAIKLSPARRKLVRLFMQAIGQKHIRQGFLALIHSPTLSPLVARAFKRIGRVEDNIPIDQVFKKIDATTCEVLSNQFTEILNFEPLQIDAPFKQTCYLGMSINDPTLDFQKTLKIAQTQFSNVELKTFTFPYHQPPRRLNFGEMVQEYGEFAEIVSRNGKVALQEPQ